MKRTTLSIIFPLLFACSATAQYYYKDILVPGQTREQLLKLKARKLKSVKVTSYESDGQPTEDFSGSQEVSGNYTKITTSLSSAINGSSQLTSVFNANGQLVKTIDTTDGAGSVNDYSYNETGKLTRILNHSTSPGGYSEKEEHIWQYNSSGKPEKMYRIRNNTDTTYVTFITDEKGNIAEENSLRNNKPLQSLYYYYDEQNRLTDIARFNDKAGRILPDFIFEYNEKGMVSSMLAVPEGSDNYQKWYYEYNDAGLKIRENCFNKQKKLLGKIGYSYE